MGSPFETAFVRESAFGTLAAVHLPEGLAPVPDTVLSRLSAEERAQALTLGGRRQIEFVGGRLAWQRSGGQGPLLSSPRGQPLVRAPLSVSITHKNDLAIALVNDAALGTLGVDLEGGGREPLGIASRVLRPEELAHHAALPDSAKWPHLVRCFAVKEATYKAIHPHVERYVSFHEARVSLEPLSVEMVWAPPNPTLALEVVLEDVGPRVLAMVRARPSR